MRIMLVTFRFGRDIPGGAERYLWELMSRLSRAGHDVEVFTTCSLQMLRSPFGYMLWDDFLPQGVDEIEGVAIHRYPVRNPRPRRASRYWNRLSTMHERKTRSPEFVTFFCDALRGSGEHCFLNGWHACEQRGDFKVRWSGKQAQLVIAGEGIREVWLEVSTPQDLYLALGTSDHKQKRFDLEKGKPRRIHAEVPNRDCLAVSIKVPRTLRPPEDRRDLGVLVHGAGLRDEAGERELDLSRGWAEFVQSGPEEVLGEALWWIANKMPARISRMHKYVMGPCSSSLEREVMRSAPGFDLVIGSMAPMSTLSLAAEAAAGSGRPFIAFPLFHSRDPNHYFGHLGKAMAGARGVEANLQGIADIMTAWGYNAFAVGPGFELEDLLSPHIDGGRFRREFGLEASPLLLWVARKNEGKGYREAIAALEYVRSRGCQAELVMIGPDEDYMPVSGEGVHYLGPLPREKVLDAYDACDVFIFPSLHESFCLVFGEAWLRGKPVLGNGYCAAARGNITHGEDGFLCYDRSQYGQRALELLNDPALARSMGQRGKENVVASRGWDRIVRELVAKLEEAVAAE